MDAACMNVCMYSDMTHILITAYFLIGWYNTIKIMHMLIRYNRFCIRIMYNTIKYKEYYQINAI